MEVSLNSSSVSTQLNNNKKSDTPVLLNATLEDEKIYFTEEIVRLEHSIKLLTESNSILHEQGDSDPDFVLAIKENEEVIAKYRKIIKNLKERLDAISKTSCLSQVAGSEINLNKENSVSEEELNKNLQSLKLTTQEISSLESIPATLNNSSEENNESNSTEKNTLESEEKMSIEEDGVFL